MNTIDIKGDAQVFKELIEGTISEFTDDSITEVYSNAFYGCAQLRRVDLARVSKVGASAFANCTALSEISLPLLSSAIRSAFMSCGIQHAEFPLLRKIDSNLFTYCESLQTASFASATFVGSAAFSGCSNLAYAYFPMAGQVATSAFYHCSRLMSLYLLRNSVATMTNSTAFSYTPMSNSSYTGSFGSIYVPASLVDSYKSANNWSLFSDRITAYTEE